MVLDKINRAPSANKARERPILNTAGTLRRNSSNKLLLNTIQKKGLFPIDFFQEEDNNDLKQVTREISRKMTTTKEKDNINLMKTIKKFHSGNMTTRANNKTSFKNFNDNNSLPQCGKINNDAKNIRKVSDDDISTISNNSSNKIINQRASENIFFNNKFNNLNKSAIKINKNNKQNFNSDANNDDYIAESLETNSPFLENNDSTSGSSLCKNKEAFFPAHNNHNSLQASHHFLNEFNQTACFMSPMKDQQRQIRSAKVNARTESKPKTNKFIEDKKQETTRNKSIKKVKFPIIALNAKEKKALNEDFALILNYANRYSDDVILMKKVSDLLNNINDIKMTINQKKC